MKRWQITLGNGRVFSQVEWTWLSMNERQRLLIAHPGSRIESVITKHGAGQ